MGMTENKTPELDEARRDIQRLCQCLESAKQAIPDEFKWIGRPLPEMVLDLSRAWRDSNESWSIQNHANQQIKNDELKKVASQRDNAVMMLRRMIQNVSGDAAYKTICDQAADWLRRERLEGQITREVEGGTGARENERGVVGGMLRPDAGADRGEV